MIEFEPYSASDTVADLMSPSIQIDYDDPSNTWDGHEGTTGGGGSVDDGRSLRQSHSDLLELDVELDVEGADPFVQYPGTWNLKAASRKEMAGGGFRLLS